MFTIEKYPVIQNTTVYTYRLLAKCLVLLHCE